LWKNGLRSSGMGRLQHLQQEVCSLS